MASSPYSQGIRGSKKYFSTRGFSGLGRATITPILLDFYKNHDFVKLTPKTTPNIYIASCKSLLVLELTNRSSTPVRTAESHPLGWLFDFGVNRYGNVTFRYE